MNDVVVYFYAMRTNVKSNVCTNFNMCFIFSIIMFYLVAICITGDSNCLHMYRAGRLIREYMYIILCFPFFYNGGVWHCLLFIGCDTP